MLELGALVEKATRDAIWALRERRAPLAQSVIEGDRRIDLLEVELEEECLKLLALHQPMADDLRFLASCLKINNDLERVGDLATNIAERALDLEAGPPERFPQHMIEMTEFSVRMLRESLDAFVNRDVALARRVCAEDDIVDQYHAEIMEELRKDMQSSPALVNRSTQLFSISICLERIADHATNIAEDVVYMVEGDIIRHPGPVSMRA
jgi:phosphate transport system protein